MAKRSYIEESKVKITWEENLAGAIIIQAVDDYRMAQKRIRQYPYCDGLIEESRSRMAECELFFRSEWFGVLTGIDPEALIKRLRSERKMS